MEKNFELHYLWPFDFVGDHNLDDFDFACNHGFGHHPYDLMKQSLTQNIRWFLFCDSTFDHDYNNHLYDHG
jgi:hypothetical protein